MLLWMCLVHNLCWKLECWLYIFATTRSNRVCKSFSLSLLVSQLNCLRKSKGLSLGELIRLQRIYFPNTFALVLDSNLHDLNGTNPDWRCFQQNCHGVIYVQEQTFSEWPETSRSHFSENKKNTCKIWRPGGPLPVHEGGGRPPGRAPYLVGPLVALWCQLQLHILVFRERKNQREEIIAFYNTKPPPSPKTSREGWSGVRLGLWRGGFVAVVIINHPPSPISWCSPPCVSNCIVGLLDGDGLDEIYHVIELVLLGFDP